MTIKRTGIKLGPDAQKVILRPFTISDEHRIKKITDRVLSLPESDVLQHYQEILSGFDNRHKDLTKFFRRRFSELKQHINTDLALSEERALLIGAYFSHEYSYEAAALFNPAIVWHPDQSGLPAGSKRFILSLRATGEGHISSLTFRTGVIDRTDSVALAEPGPYPSTAKIIERLPEDQKHEYQLVFDRDSDISERVIFPVIPSESNGIEDARFVCFDHGQEAIYYATYTAYDGHHIRVRLLETKDFIQFKSRMLNGPAVVNKGLALFPRMINGKYAMLGRQDNENNYIMFSDDLYYWNGKTVVQSPAYPWEFIQLGNCGSPIETDAGWLVFSHGVGAMRRYSIGAFLLDLDDPARLIGRTPQPILTPDEDEREGYVPNVVYTCGAALHGSEVVLPYAMSDSAASFALINLQEILASMQKNTG
jgi:predicted GH43/DUF377 family glycosyl hydrolase